MFSSRFRKNAEENLFEKDGFFSRKNTHKRNISYKILFSLIFLFGISLKNIPKIKKHKIFMPT